MIRKPTPWRRDSELESSPQPPPGMAALLFRNSFTPKVFIVHGEFMLAPAARSRLTSRLLMRYDPMIEVENLTKRYAGTTAVSGVSFRVERGEIVGLLGQNGAGKSTIMRILSGFMPATA